MRHLLHKNAEPECIIRYKASAYGASRTADETVIDIFTQTIRDQKLRWRHAGTAKWDDHHGLYAIPGGFPDAAVADLEECLRRL